MYLVKNNPFKIVGRFVFWKDYFSRGTYVLMDEAQGRESRILDSSPKLSTYTMVQFIRPNLYCACLESNAIPTFTPSKISFPSPENFLSNRAEHWARQINCVTKSNNPTRRFFPTQPQLKLRLALLFWKEYYFHYYYSENSILFKTYLLKNVLLLFSRLLFLLFWKGFLLKFLRRLLFWK